MDPGTVLKVVHAVLGIWIIAALVGRWMTLRQAARSMDLEIGSLVVVFVLMITKPF